MPRCNICRRPLEFTYVEVPRYGLDGKPVQYRNVRRYYCPEGCRGVRLDFSVAKPAASGVLLRVAPKVKPLRKKPDFNDRLLAVGLGLAYLLMVMGILAIPAAWPLRAAGAFAVTLALLATYRFATQRVELPSYFPVPYPTAQQLTSELAAAAPAAAAAAPAAAAKPAAAPAPAPAAAAKPAAAPAPAPTPAAAPKGGGVTMKVILAGQEYTLDVAPGENMLDAALDRDVALDFSCREGLCDSCAVRVLAGLENISPPTKAEYDMLGEDVNRGVRLACQVIVKGPVTIQQG